MSAPSPSGSWSKERIRAVQRKAGVTGNDVVTAIVAGVLRSWLIDQAELPKQPLVAIGPITVRGREHGPRTATATCLVPGYAHWAPTCATLPNGLT